MRNTILLSIALLLSIAVTAQKEKKTKTYKVLASCGSCQMDMNSPTGCALSIQLGGKKYWVDGSTVHDYGDEHAEDGLCETVRKAEVQGTIEGNRILATSFVLLPEKKKKEKGKGKKIPRKN